jgi:hypothetical protein
MFCKPKVGDAIPSPGTRPHTVVGAARARLDRPTADVLNLAGLGEVNRRRPLYPSPPKEMPASIAERGG